MTYAEGDTRGWSVRRDDPWLGVCITILYVPALPCVWTNVPVLVGVRGIWAFFL